MFIRQFKQSTAIFSLWFLIMSVHLGIVLKKAKITKKGTSKSNVASGSVVETLVVLSSNIVQIVAEVFFLCLLTFP